MKHWILSLVIVFIAFISLNVYGHDDEKEKKPAKVSSATVQEPDTQAAESVVAERDFEIIRSEVQSSTTFIVIKALALAVAIIGLGAVYLPRKRWGKGNNENV